MTLSHKPVWDRIDYSHDSIIEASAGTGKTFTLVKIVVKLVGELGYDAKNILLVTYTEKAAGELRDRIRRGLEANNLLKADFDEMTIATIHSFCREILDQYAFENALPMRKEVLASARTLARKSVIAALKSEEFALALQAAKEKNDNIPSPGVIIAELAQCLFEEKPQEEIERVFSGGSEALKILANLALRKYNSEKDSGGVITFDDMVNIASEVLVKKRGLDDATHARLVESIRRRYRVALVDEFQDTDEKQWGIFRTLFSAKANCVEGLKQGFLIAVGDPKQAIYSFRGADVRVYCQARDEIAPGGDARWRLSLDKTYRARKTLVEAFNTMFSADGWFNKGSAGEGIDYSCVDYPEKNAKFEDGKSGKLGACVSLIESLGPHEAPAKRGGFGNKARCLKVFARNAAGEMLRLCSLGYKFGEMCVLVETREDAKCVRRMLASRGIPYAQYKQPGLYDSPEAEAAIALFDYLDFPGHKGRRAALLLSPVFAVELAHLERLPQKEEDSISSFLSRLEELAAKRDWARLFEEVMTSDESALMHPEKFGSSFNRVRSSIRQIFDALLEWCADILHSPADFSAHLRELRMNDAAAGEDGALYSRESDAERVQIMTMHASKGLEFPFVFVAGGFSRLATKQEADKAEEKRRLYYVAITRAELRVYLPWSQSAWLWENHKGEFSCGIGSQGSALYAPSSNQNAFLASAIMALFPKRDGAVLPHVIDADDIGRLTAKPQIPADHGTADNSQTSAPCEIALPNLWPRRILCESFSSISSRSNRALRQLEDAELENDDVERETPLDLAPSLLPRTNISGIAFHEMMQELSNCAWRDDAFEPAAKHALERNSISDGTCAGDSTSKLMVRMAKAALCAKLHFARDTFSLDEISSGDMMAEADFAISEQLVAQRRPDMEGDVFTGQTDLIVRRGNSAYIIDWKTNSLGAYTPEAVQREMDECGYHLQYKLYALAASRYLESQGISLAGAAYIFVRGVEAGDEPGVFLRDFDDAALEQFRNDVKRS